jgi:transposase-like protein
VPKPSSKPKSSSPSSEVVAPRPARRIFTPADKLRIVQEAAKCTERGEVEALLRREGIYSSHLTNWRKLVADHSVAALAARRPGRKPKRDEKDVRIETLERKTARLEKELELARKVIDFQKKLSEILGVELPKVEEP